MTQPYHVHLDGVVVGYLDTSREGRVGFRFAESYRNLPRGNRPILGQRFEDDLERTYLGKRPGELPPFFAHLLPGGRLRAVLEHSLRLEAPTDLELLAAVGHDLPGALRIALSDGSAPDLGSDERDDDEGVPQSGLGLRFSLAGMQLKFSVLERDQRFTLPAHDALGDWILKLALSEYEGLAENEYSVMTWARAAGFDVPEVRIVPHEELGMLRKYAPVGSTAFAIRRYDRDADRRIHQEDLAQVFGLRPQFDGSEKYGSTHEIVAAVFRGVLGDDALREFIRRATFVVASGNNDAHLKNWSLVYPDRVTPAYSPLYDQVATVAWPKLDRKLALKFSSTREFSRVSLRFFRRLAAEVGLDEELAASLVAETLQALRIAWSEGAAALLPPGHADALREHWRRVPLLRDAGPLV